MARESGGTTSVAPTRNGTSQSNQNQINQAENEAETSTHQNEQQVFEIYYNFSFIDSRISVNLF